jgi:hypothetical protein
MDILFIINFFVVVPLMVIGLIFLASEIILDVVERINRK